MLRPLAACMAMISVSAAVLIGACGASSQGSSGGSCAALSPAQDFARARVVFLGTMLPGPTADLGGASVLVSPARVRVTRYLKGGGPGVVTVVTGLTSGSVVNEEGIEPQIGQLWKIYTLPGRMPYQTSICDGSKPTGKAPIRRAAANGVLNRVAATEQRVRCGQGRQQPGGPPPAGFVAGAAILCVQTFGQVHGRTRVVWIKWEAKHDLTPLVTALRKPSAHFTAPGDCPERRFRPMTLFLIDHRGQIAQPAIPHDGCGQPQQQVLTAVRRLPWITVRAATPALIHRAESPCPLRARSGGQPRCFMVTCG